uniref:Coiled-coil domain-containing protein n=1 Tax=Phaeodactylum tricornutum TaxID=2850 RepID=A0A8J9X4X5_PHATR
MGRVARYKKVKACDPYSKENGGRIQLDEVGIWGIGKDSRKPKKRSKTSERLRVKRKKTTEIDDGFDAPPEKGDDFDMADLYGTLKQEKVQNEQFDLGSSVKAHTTIITKTPSKPNPPIDEDDKKTNMILKLDEQVDKKKAAVQSLGRMEGETKNAFRKRVKAETRQIIKRERMDLHNPEKRQKKKEFLNKEKSKKRKASSLSFGDDDDESNYQSDTTVEKNGGLITGERAVAARAVATQAHFGEQAERPPVFRQLPRGAIKKADKKSSVSKLFRDEDILAEHQAMESIRRKVQAQYSLIKRQRKSNNDFHL